MPTYRLTIDAIRWAPGAYTSPEAARVFDVYVQAPTALAARVMFRAARPGKVGVTDPRDGAWFDTWRIERARKARVFEVVTTDNTAWHSGGITGTTVFYDDKRRANEHLKTTRATRKPGQGAFMRSGR